MRRIRVVALLALAAAAGCMSGRGVVPGSEYPGGPPVESTKKVAAKRPPDLLVADDASVCGVSRERFGSTQPGALVRCAWRPVR